MSTTSNSVPAGKENSILTVLSVSEVAEYLGVGKNSGPMSRFSTS